MIGKEEDTDQTIIQVNNLRSKEYNKKLDI